MVSIFSVINLTPSIINIEYAILIYTYCAYSRNNPIHLTRIYFQVPLQTGKVNSWLSNLPSFFEKRFFVSFFLLAILFQFWIFLFGFDMIFVSFGYLFLVLP